jgi:dolichol-phosphate mannosyltransferase
VSVHRFAGYRSAAPHPELRRMARFALVGALGVLVNSGVLWLLTDRAAMYYLWASVVATEVAIVCNFTLNHVWTFQASADRGSLLRRLLHFNAVSVAGMVLTVAVLFALRQFVGLHYLTANVLAVGVAGTWNYVANRKWTWRMSPVVQP